VFQTYNHQYLEMCLALFDLNCPEYFAENERDDYKLYLQHNAGSYNILLDGVRLVAAFGIDINPRSKRGRIAWIMVAPNNKGQGVGDKMMASAKLTCAKKGLKKIDIAASHLSSAFFAKYGAIELSRTVDGWGKDMHRVDMLWSI
jgi:N-acetylglutamate synthase-like GNAT family acetyltransferase